MHCNSSSVPRALPSEFLPFYPLSRSYCQISVDVPIAYSHREKMSKGLSSFFLNHHHRNCCNMGIPELWKILSPAEETKSFSEYTITEGIRRPQKSLVLGVDVSLWFYQICNAFLVGHSQAGPNPELKAFFYKLGQLNRLPIRVLAIFDGIDRPTFKRNKRVGTRPHWLTSKAQELLTAFGFDWYTAPGEAEAELAYLNQSGIIDAVLSDDGDTFLFGALCVIRNPKVDKDSIKLYTANGIKDHADISLTRGGMILIALMAGGDYDTTGLKDCGALTAHRVARTGLGDSLLHAALTLPQSSLSDFLDQWRKTLRNQLANDPSGSMGRKYPTLSQSIPDTFPDPTILLAYASPTTSASPGYTSQPLCVRPSGANIALLARLCKEWFEWPDVIERFEKCLWPGSVLRMLNTGTSGPQTLTSFDVSSILEILRVKTKHEVKEYYVRLSTTSLTAAAKSGLTVTIALNPKISDPTRSSSSTAKSVATSFGRLNNADAASSSTTSHATAAKSDYPINTRVDDATFSRMWVPAAILESALPVFVQTFEASRVSKEKSRKRKYYETDSEDDDDAGSSATTHIRPRLEVPARPIDSYLRDPEMLPHTNTGPQESHENVSLSQSMPFASASYHGHIVCLNGSDSEARPPTPVPAPPASTFLGHIDLTADSDEDSEVDSPIPAAAPISIFCGHIDLTLDEDGEHSGSTSRSLGHIDMTSDSQSDSGDISELYKD